MSYINPRHASLYLASLPLLVTMLTFAGCGDDGDPGLDPSDRDSGVSMPSDGAVAPDSADLEGGADGGADAEAEDGGMPPVDAGGVCGRDFHNLYDLAGYADFTSVTELPSGDLVVVGTAEGFGSGGSDGVVVRFAPDGTHRWSRSVGTSTTDELLAVADDGAGGVIVAGRTIYDRLNSDGLLARLDADGDTVFSRVISPPVMSFTHQRFELHAALPLGGDETLIVGVDTSQSSTSPGASPSSSGFAAVVDGAGAILRQRTIRDNNMGFFDAIRLSDGDILVSGAGPGRALALRLNASDLTVRWRSTFPGDYFTSAIELPGGDLVLGGVYVETRFTTDFSHWFLARATRDGEAVWIRQLELEDSVLQGLVIHDGKIVASGEVSAADSLDAHVAVLDFDGFIVREFPYAIATDDWFSAATTTADGSLVMAGGAIVSSYAHGRLVRYAGAFDDCGLESRFSSMSLPTVATSEAGDFGTESAHSSESFEGLGVANGPSMPTVAALACGM